MTMLEQIEAWKRIWAERMSRGYFGAVTADEEGNRYLQAVVRSGKLVIEDDQCFVVAGPVTAGPVTVSLPNLAPGQTITVRNTSGALVKIFGTAGYEQIG